jgi:hypothetical protein
LFQAIHAIPAAVLAFIAFSVRLDTRIGDGTARQAYPSVVLAKS